MPTRAATIEREREREGTKGHQAKGEGGGKKILGLRLEFSYPPPPCFFFPWERKWSRAMELVRRKKADELLGVLHEKTKGWWVVNGLRDEVYQDGNCAQH
jgi:hypothetical protein